MPDSAQRNVEVVGKSRRIEQRRAQDLFPQSRA